ncbi:MAG: phosphate signaling complex protein PhoU [Pseudomonadota bacterium]
MPADHIVGAFDSDLRSLRDGVAEMGGLAEAQLAGAIDAIARRDTDLAQTTRASDARIDALEQEINAAVVRLLALRQPMAVDLREIVAALKIASDLERIGDYAANVAKRTEILAESPPVQPARSIPFMGEVAQRMVHDALDAFADRDPEKALMVWRSDEELDAIYTSLFRELLTYMMEDPRTITPCTHLLFVAKNFERIGDHATNIAETLHYAVSGEALTADRPKGDRSPTIAPDAPSTANGDASPS